MQERLFPRAIGPNASMFARRKGQEEREKQSPEDERGVGPGWSQGARNALDRECSEGKGSEEGPRKPIAAWKRRRNTQGGIGYAS
jgi:hypothetical protein